MHVGRDEQRRWSRWGCPISIGNLPALGDATRLGLVRRLGTSGPQSIAGLSRGAGVTRQAVTKHLHVLASAGLVHGGRRGRESIWELDPRRLAQARAYLDDISAQWDEALGRLKALVERDSRGA